MSITSNAAALAAFNQVNSAGGGDTSAGPITGRFGSGNVRIIPASTTFTPTFTGPHEVRLWGAGNAGFDGAVNGGGAGGFAYGIVSLTAGVGVTVTVGAGAVTPNVGGGTTSFGAYLSATGGVASSGNGGSGVGGTRNFSGGDGGASQFGGGGAASLYGDGGDGDAPAGGVLTRASGGGAWGDNQNGRPGLTGAPGESTRTADGAGGFVYWAGSAHTPADLPLDYWGTGSGGAGFGGTGRAGTGQNGGGGGSSSSGVGGAGGFPGGGGGSGTPPGAGADGLVIVRW